MKNDADIPAEYANFNPSHCIVFYKLHEDGTKLFYHAAAYEELPRVADISNSIEELKTDKEFGIGASADLLAFETMSWDELQNLLESLEV